MKRARIQSTDTASTLFCNGRCKAPGNGAGTMAGFSIVELMVAVTISTLLLMGVVALFVSSRASYETTERLSRIQENGRYALDQFMNDVRAAGYQGCARTATGPRAEDYTINTVSADPSSMLWNFAVPAQGFQALGEDGWSPALDVTPLQPQPSSTADVLVLRIPARNIQPVELLRTQQHPADPLDIGVINPAPFRTGDVAMITDCLARAWFTVTGYVDGMLLHDEVPGGPESPGNSSASLEHPFQGADNYEGVVKPQAGAEILPVTTMVYYLAPGTGDPSLLSLWRKTGNTPNSDEIAEGIERLEVRYGVDTNGDGRVDQYVDASAVNAGNWGAVYAVQIALLARAPEAYGAEQDTQVYTLLSDPAITAGPFMDRHLRKVFAATVAVRNQIVD